MGETETRHLRVLIANEKRERLELLAQVVAGFGHEVISREIYVKEVGAVSPLRRLNHRRRGSAPGPEAIRPRERCALGRGRGSSWLTSAPRSAIELTTEESNDGDHRHRTAAAGFALVRRDG